MRALVLVAVVACGRASHAVETSAPPVKDADAPEVVTATAAAAASSGPASPSSAPAPASSAPLDRWDGPAACRFAKPASWTAGVTTWLGACAGGKATGKGALRNADDGVEEVFFGELANGEPVIGVVVNTLGGYTGGRWADGDVVQEQVDPRPVAVKAFDVAAAAARAAADRAARAGDGATAASYRARAKKLENQLD
jgi:hypothetical protein